MFSFVPTPLLLSRLPHHTNNNALCRPPIPISPHAMSCSTFTPTFTLPRPLTSAPTFLTMRVENSPQSSVLTGVSDTRLQQLRDIIISGPVFKSARLSMRPDSAPFSADDPHASSLEDWICTGSILEDLLGRQSNDTRVYQYYLPVYFWILRELQIHQQNIASSGSPVQRPLILSFCCPQGGGKTTMTTFIQTLLRSVGKSVQIASLDDFYVTNQQQNKIASDHPENRLVQYRGMPGTHDLDLLNDTLDRLRAGHDVSIPRYDKTAFNGRGDRAPKEKWVPISETTDLVLFEGWCIGFEPVDEENIHNPDLHLVNNALHDFVNMYKRIDGLFLVEISNMNWVFEWRLQAERGTRAAGKPGLSDDEVVDFVSRFMPAYKQYSAPLYKRPTPLFPRHELHIEIDEARRPVHRKPHRKPFN